MSSPMDQAAALGFSVICVSHVLRPALWRQGFLALFGHPAAPFVVAVLTLPIGLLLAFTHSITTWSPQWVFAAYGWAAIAKSISYLWWPAAFRGFVRGRLESEQNFRVAGVLFLSLAAWMWWAALVG